MHHLSQQGREIAERENLPRPEDQRIPVTTTDTAVNIPVQTGNGKSGNGRRIVITADGLVETIYGPKEAAQLNGTHLDQIGNGQ